MKRAQRVVIQVGRGGKRLQRGDRAVELGVDRGDQRVGELLGAALEDGALALREQPDGDEREDHHGEQGPQGKEQQVRAKLHRLHGSHPMLQLRPLRHRLY
jgi:hypothetical protein